MWWEDKEYKEEQTGDAVERLLTLFGTHEAQAGWVVVPRPLTINRSGIGAGGQLNSTYCYGSHTGVWEPKVQQDAWLLNIFLVFPIREWKIAEFTLDSSGHRPNCFTNNHCWVSNEHLLLSNFRTLLLHGRYFELIHFLCIFAISCFLWSKHAEVTR